MERKRQSESMYNAKKVSVYNKFINDEKSGYNNLLIFGGKEPYLSRWATNRIISRNVNPLTKMMDLTEMDEMTFSFKELEQSMESRALTGGRRVTVVRLEDAFFLKPEEDRIVKLLQSCDDRIDDNILVFHVVSEVFPSIPAKIKKLFTTYEFGKLNRGELYKFIHNQLKYRRANFDDSSIYHLIDVSGYLMKDSDYDLFKLTGDIDKIVSLTNEDNSISLREAIEEVVLGYREAYVFSLVDVVFAKDKGRAIVILNNIFSSDKEEGSRITGLLISSVELALSIYQLKREGVSASEASKILGINKFRSEMLLKNTVRMKEKDIKELLLNTYTIDQNLKKGTFDERTSLEYFVANL